jgi:UDP-N-acetylmuramoylalanine--D-glutamate ligase
MNALNGKNVLVVGMGLSGRAACELLLSRGARVTAVDGADTPDLRAQREALRVRGVTLELGARSLAAGRDRFDLAVISPGVGFESPLMEALRQAGVRCIGEVELGYQQSRCLSIAITGTNGKTTTTELVEGLLSHAHRRTIAAGNIGRPLCSVVEQTAGLDFLTLEISSFQLEGIEFFRPAVAVLLNITPDHLDRYTSMADYTRAKARVFMNQQAFDWAIIQSEALAQLRALEVSIPAKVITFSASNRRADLYLDRSLLVSRLPDWSGLLLDMDDGQLRGPHNAENLMAALAVGRVLKVPLAQMVEALLSYRPAAHRCELVAELGGVRFVNDSKATNVDAVQKAIESIPPAGAAEPNIWLIAGGRDKGFSYHEIGPLLSERVKGAFLLGETREKLRAAWSLFTPCTLVGSLLEAVTEAAREAQPGDVVLLSPACSSFDMFQNYQQRGEVFRQAVEAWVATTRGAAGPRATSASGVCRTDPLAAQHRP